MTEAWITRLKERESRCPWPGPRPLEQDEDQLLAGRGWDRQRFAQLVREHAVVLLSGDSGVGKSSLLNAALIPDLVESDYAVLTCNVWPSITDESDGEPISFFVEALRRSARFFEAKSESPLHTVNPAHHVLLQRALELDDPNGVLAALSQAFGERFVLVLDQFEELIRYSESVGEGVLDMVVYLSQRYRMRQVLAFRSEYLHKLQIVQDGVESFDLSSHPLLPIDPEDALEIITAPWTCMPAVTFPLLDDKAAAQVADAWKSALDAPATAGDPFDRIGTLHLQAFLYVLFFDGRLDEVKEPLTPAALEARWNGTACQRVSPGEPIGVRSAICDLAQSDQTQRAADLRECSFDGLIADGGLAQLAFRHAIVRSVTVKLGHCRAEIPSEVDYLGDEAVAAVGQLSPYLSSGGYKLTRDVGDLARNALARELGVLRLESSGCQPLVRDHLEPFIALVDGDAVEEPGRFEKLLAPITPTFDPVDRWSNGRAFGWSQEDCLDEELRAFAIALSWLRVTRLLRQTTLRPGQRLCSLVHDGFGQAMELWSSARAGDPRERVRGVTASLGDAFDWKDDQSDDDGLFTGPGQRVVAEIRWLGTWIRARFERVTFVNCDLRGTIFSHCSFDAVRFIGCQLDGVLFENCEIRGQLGDKPFPEPESDRNAWPTRRAVVAVPNGYRLRHHRDLAALAHREDQLVEELDELPDVSPPGSVILTVGGTVDGQTPTELHGEFDLVLDPPAGGLTVMSCVLDGLTFRETVTQQGSGLALGFLRGNTLNLQDHRGGGWLLESSLLRHVALAGARAADDGGSNQDEWSTGDAGLPGGVIANCHLIQVVFGDRMTGTTDIKRSIVVQAWNQGDINGGHTVHLSDDSSSVGSVGLRGGSQVPQPLGLDDVDPDGRTRSVML